MSFDAGYFQCDKCPDYIDTDESGYTEALVIAKRRGWRTFKNSNGEWMHTCPSCVAKFAAENRQS